MKILKFPFLSLSSFFALGILSYPFLDKPKSLVFILIAGIIGLITIGSKIFHSFFLRFAYWSCCFLCFYILGVLTVHVHSIAFQSNHYTHLLSDNDRDFIKFSVRKVLKSNSHAQRYIVEVLIVNDKRAKGRLLLLVDKKSDVVKLKVGDQCSVFQIVSPFQNVVNPHQFDYRRYMALDGVHGQIQLRDSDLKREGWSAGPLPVLALIRDGLLSSFDIHGFSTEVSAIVASLLFGQRHEISDDLKSNFKDLGVMHILAISGLHVGVVYLFLVQILKRLRLKQRHIYGLAVLVLWFFALITGFATPVVRAVVVFSIMALVYGTVRAADPYNSLAVAFFLTLCCNPFYIYDIGFQLSYLAVFSIVFFYPIMKPFTNSKWGLWRYAKEVIAVSLAVQFGILPLSIYYFHYIPVFFLLGNLVVLPLVTLILIALLLVLVLNFLWTKAALILGEFSAFLIDLMNALIRRLSRLAIYNLEELSLSGVLTGISIAVAILAGFALKSRKTQLVVPVLAGLLVFQLVYMYTALSDQHSSEYLLLYNRKHCTFLFKEQRRIRVFSNDVEMAGKRVISDYCKHHFIDSKSFEPLPQLLQIYEKKLLIIDSAGVFETDLKADILVLVGHSKINFSRAIAFHEPDLVLSCATFPPWDSKRVSEVCAKKNIPFHSVSEKGYYKF